VGKIDAMNNAADPDRVTYRWPTLACWLERASPTHPLQFLVNDPDEAYGAIGDSYEEMLSYLEELNPKRLDRKRRDFSADERGVLELRTELLVGYRLGKGGVCFEFGAKGQPDYVCATDGGEPAFVEVTSRILDGLADLQHDLDAAIADLDVAVILTSPRLLKITEDARRSVCEQVVAAARTLETANDSATIALPEISGSAGIQKSTAFAPEHSHVGLNTSAELTQHMADVTDQMRCKLLEKARQAKKGAWHDRTLAVVDASRLGMSWISPSAVWAGRLEQMGIPWHELPFAGVCVTFSTMVNLGLDGGALLRPGLPAEDETALHEVLVALGFARAAA
jgi:hypothetical protein